MRQLLNDFVILGAALFIRRGGKGAIFYPIGILQFEFSFNVFRFLRRKFRSFRESKPRPFENLEGAGTRKFKGWRTRLKFKTAQKDAPSALF
jgi:hypothetical protein